MRLETTRAVTGLIAGCVQLWIPPGEHRNENWDNSAVTFLKADIHTHAPWTIAPYMQVYMKIYRLSNEPGRCMYMNSFPGLIKLVPRPTFRNTAVTNQHPNITCYSSDLPRISWFTMLKIIIGLASRWESSPQLLREKRSAARTHRSTFAHTVKISEDFTVK